MTKLVFITKSEIEELMIEKLLFRQDKDVNINQNIFKIFDVLKKGIICNSFLEGWTNKHLERYKNLLSDNNKELCSLVPTSATTGPPKLCMYSSYALEEIYEVEYKEDFINNRIYSSLSFSHSYMYPGTILPVIGRAESFIIDRSGYPLMFPKIIKDYSLNMIISVPSQLIAWSKLPFCLPEIKYIYSAGGPFPFSHLDKLRLIFPNCVFINNYGATECGPRIGSMVICNNTNANKFNLIKPGKISLQDNRAIYTSPRIMMNYLGKENIIDYFELNDNIKLASSHFLVQGRIDRVFNFGGKKLSYEFIEEVLNNHDVKEKFYFDDKSNKLLLCTKESNFNESIINSIASVLMIERSYIGFTSQTYPKTYK